MKKENSKIKKMKIERTVENAKSELNDLVKKYWVDIYESKFSSITAEDLINAEIEIAETEVEEIIHEDEISFSAPKVELSVPVYLDENYEWFFKIDSIIPWLNTDFKKECLKSFKNYNSKEHGKLVKCYPIKDIMTDFMVNSILLLNAKIKLSSSETKNKEV